MSHARRTELAQWFRSVLPRLDPGPAVAESVARLRPGLAGARSVLVIAFGKAARPMAAAAVAALDGLAVRGLCAPPEPDAAALPPLEVLPGGHPLPTAGSLRAAQRALELCRTADPRDRVLFLVSGGGSSILELPVDPAVTIDELRTFQQALVGCGAPIAAINTVRKHLSLVKGGRLAAAAAHCAGLNTIAVSDVADETLAALASGPTCPERSTLADCRAIVAQYGLHTALPAAFRERLARGDLPPPIASHHPVFQRSAIERTLDNEHARCALQQVATAHGIHVVVDPIDDLPCERTADHLLARLRQLRREHASGPVAVLNGGEVTVRLPSLTGHGGRNQQFALQCALRCEGEPITVLSAGTDGIDGNSPAAGATADGDTVARAAACGLDAALQLRHCDAFPLFDRLGDAIVTGPTGTNVRDVRLLVHE